MCIFNKLQSARGERRNWKLKTCRLLFIDEPHTQRGRGRDIEGNTWRWIAIKEIKHRSIINFWIEFRLSFLSSHSVVECRAILEQFFFSSKFKHYLKTTEWLTDRKTQRHTMWDDNDMRRRKRRAHSQSLSVDSKAKYLMLREEISLKKVP